MRLTPIALAIPIFLFLALPVRAQIDAQFAHYADLPSYYNPAAVARNSEIEIAAVDRLQWIGISGAPTSFWVTANSPFKLFGKLQGGGISLYNETIGLFTTMAINLQYSYQTKLWGGKLSLGLQAGMIDQRFNADKIKIPDGGDNTSSGDVVPTGELQSTAFDIGLGGWYTKGNWWAGLSITHLTAPQFSFDDKHESQAPRNYYLMSGYNIQFKNPLYYLQPSLFIKSDLHVLQAEAGARIWYNRFFYLGAAYRWKEAAIVSIGASYKGIQLGYSYEIPTTRIITVSSGSHEIFVRYLWKLDLSGGSKNVKHKSIRIL